jgi:hypothetical protein
MERKPARPTKDDARRAEAADDFKWQATIKAVMASLPGLVSDHMSPDSPRVVIRLP